jgi:TRAP transporter TAXI family solute receptor
VYYAAGHAICEAVNRAAERQAASGADIVMQCRYGPSGGSVFNIRQVSTGAFTFAIVQANDQRVAVDGTDPQRIKSVPNLRSVLQLQPEVLQVVLPPDSKIKSVADFAGKRLSAGNRGSGTRVLTHKLVEAHGLSDDDFAAVENRTMETEATALCTGHVDVFVVVSAAPTQSVTDAMNRCGARLMPLRSPEIKELLATSPDLVSVEIPATVYPAMKKTVPTIGVRAGLVTREEMPDEIVRDVVAAVIGELPILRAAHPSLASLQPEEMVPDGNGAPVHEGAKAYFEARGWQ